MKITELDKKIIEHIKPYMDKRLSFGCLLKCDEVYIISAYDYPDYWDNNLYTFTHTDYKWEIYIESESIEWMNIIGHYDITSVLKYILQKNWDWNSMIMQDYIHIYQDDVFVHEIPNKPLHLYTEQEKKDLLELLTKLKWQD